MIRFFISTVLLSLATAIVQAQAVPERLDSLLQSLNKDGELSGAFMLVDHGKMVYEKYLGYEDAAKTTAITADSRFELASVSKPITAMAIMQLEEQGKLAYGDFVSRFFPKLPFASTIRIKDLLHHTSGIPEFLAWDESWIDKSKVYDNRAVLEVLESKVDSLLFQPGDRYYYSNSNYVLLALIVEQVSGLSFADYLRKQVFEPAGMLQTALIPAQAAAHVKQKQYAQGLAYHAPSKTFKPIDQFSFFDYTRHFDGISGPFGVASTAQDLLKWNEALKKNTLLKRDNFVKAISVDTINNGLPVKMGDLYYGFGWIFTDSTANPEKMHFHTGGYPGYKAIVVREDKNQRYFIALLNKWNTIDVVPLTTAVNAIIQQREVPEVTREVFSEAITLMEFQIRALLGTYQFTLDPALTIVITADEDGNLFAQLTGQQAFQVFPKNDLELFYTVVKATLQFSKTDQQVDALTLLQNGQKLLFKKIK